MSRLMREGPTCSKQFIHTKILKWTFYSTFIPKFKQNIQPQYSNYQCLYSEYLDFIPLAMKIPESVHSCDVGKTALKSYIFYFLKPDRKYLHYNYSVRALGEK